MNYKFIYLFTMLPLLFYSFSQNSEITYKRERSKKIHGLIQKFASAMAEKGYRASGVSERVDHSTKNKRYNCIGITFDIERIPNIEFARKIEVETLQLFLKYINSEEGIEDYVAEYPFPINFVQIAFLSKDRRHGLSSVTKFGNKIFYYQDDSGTDFAPSKEIHSETYEEAVRILAGENISQESKKIENDQTM